MLIAADCGDQTKFRGEVYAIDVAVDHWHSDPHHPPFGLLHPSSLSMAGARKKKDRDALNRFADVGRFVLVGAATILPDRPAANSARLSAGACLLSIKLVAKGLKKAIPERRPNGEDNKSFPSEHAAECVAAAMIIEREYPGKLGALVYGLASAVCVSRIDSEKHHPRNALAGALIGCAAVWLFASGAFGG